MACDNDFTGWSSTRRLLDTGLDSIKYLPRIPTQVEFEPFGVGAYVPLFACDAMAPHSGDDHYIFRVVNDGDAPVPVSFGVAMAEDFNLLDLLRMPLLIHDTWIWSQASFAIYGLPGILFALIAVLCTAVLGVRKDEHLALFILDHVAAIFMVCNAFTFLARLIDVHVDGFQVAVPALVHILMPLIFSATLVIDTWSNMYTQPCACARDNMGSNVFLIVPSLAYASMMFVPSLRLPFGIILGVQVVCTLFAWTTFPCGATLMKRVFKELAIKRIPLLLYSMLFLWQAWWIPSLMLFASIIYVLCSPVFKNDEEYSGVAVNSTREGIKLLEF